MKIICKAFVVLQAESQEFKGLKTFQDFRIGNVLAAFPAIEDAKNYMVDLIKNIRQDQSIGWRTKNNLDKKTGLDFLIQEVDISIDTEDMESRGWKTPDLPAPDSATDKEKKL